MLDVDDVLELAPGITVENGHVHDAVRGTSWPLNATARWVLGRSGCALGEIASDLSSAHRVPIARAKNDVLSFAWQLNGALLANIDTGRSPWRRALSWLRLAVRLAPAGALPPPRARRMSLDTRSFVGALTSAWRALAGRATTVALATALVVVQLVAVMGALACAAGAAVGVGVGLGLYLHEAGHAIALRGVASAMVLVGARTFVLHGPIAVPRRACVAACGPLVAVAVGLAAVGLAQTSGAIEVAYAALPLCGHALAITVLNPDGRTACNL